MEQAEGRLMFIIPLSLGLILILLYMAFRSLLDALAVLSNVHRAVAWEAFGPCG